MHKVCIATAVFLLFVRVSFAQTAYPVNTAAPSKLDWTMENWTGSSKNYQQIQINVKQAINKSSDPLALVAQYKATAQQHISDPKPMFRWAYAAYCLSFTDPSFKSSGEVTLAGKGLMQSTSPRVYEYTRLRFVIEASTGGYAYSLKPLGERLLHRNPKDDVTKYWLVQILDNSDSSEDKQEALKYAKQLISATPQKPYGYDLLGWTYFVIQMKSHKASDGDMAIAAYRQAQRYAANNPEFCAKVERLVKLIQTSQANLAKKGGT